MPEALSCCGIERDEFPTADDVGLDRTEAREQTGRAHVVDPRHRSQRTADLLGHQRQVDERGSVTPDRLRERHRRGPHGAQAFPQVLVEAGFLSGPHCFDRAAGAEEILVRRLQGLMVLGQAVIQPAQLVAVHGQDPPCPKKNSFALLYR